MIFDLYSCLNARSTVNTADNIIEYSIFNNYYSLWHNKTKLKPIKEFNMCYVPRFFEDEK